MFLRRHWSHASWLIPLLSLSAQGHGAELTVSEDDPRALATISQHIAQHTRSVITYEELASSMRVICNLIRTRTRLMPCRSINASRSVMTPQQMSRRPWKR